jgi:hypothetical protein
MKLTLMIAQPFKTYHLMENWKNKIVNGVLDLGTMNGWGKATSDLYDQLRENKIPGTDAGQNLGRCYNAYEWKCEVDGEIITVCYKVDSGD